MIVGGGWVGRSPYSFSGLNHLDHFKTEILFKELQNKLLFKTNLDEELQPRL